MSDTNISPEPQAGEGSPPEPQPGRQVVEDSPLEPQPSPQEGEAPPVESQPGTQAVESPPSAIIGRKIFFLYPTASIQNQIITELAQQEYEVYTAKNHARLARALKKYQDSIVYINIDEGMAEPDWERWISGILSAHPDVKIGVFSSKTDEELKDKYINRLHVSCGFLTLKLDMSKTIDVILEILKITNAKGRRKYIRASTEREATATINMPHNGGFIHGLIKDISVVGVSCKFEMDPGLKKNALFKDIQIKLQSMLIKVEAVAFGSREDGGEKNYVLLFTQKIDSEVRAKIRKYIQMNLQSKMDSEIN